VFIGWFPSSFELFPPTHRGNTTKSHFCPGLACAPRVAWHSRARQCNFAHSGHTILSFHAFSYFSSSFLLFFSMELVLWLGIEFLLFVMSWEASLIFIHCLPNSHNMLCYADLHGFALNYTKNTLELLGFVKFRIPWLKMKTLQNIPKTIDNCYKNPLIWIKTK